MLKNSLITIALTLLTFAALSSFVFAEELKDDIKLFVQEGCSYCDQVKDFINENDISTKMSIEIIDIAESDDNSVQFEVHTEVCGLEANYVPMLYINGECTSNAISVIEEIKRYTGMTTVEELTEEVPEDEDPDTIDELIDKTEIEDNSLADVLDDPSELPSVPWYAYVVIAGALICLAVIAYLLINKMKV